MVGQEDPPTHTPKSQANPIGKSFTLSCAWTPTKSEKHQRGAENYHTVNDALNACYQAMQFAQTSADSQHSITEVQTFLAYSFPFLEKDTLLLFSKGAVVL